MQVRERNSTAAEARVGSSLQDSPEYQEDVQATRASQRQNQNHHTHEASPAVTRARARRRQQENQREAEIPYDKVCKVCYIAKKTTAIVPCGHTFCSSCATRVNEEMGCCPLCKQKILSLLTLYD